MAAFPVPPFDELTITLFGKPGSGKTRFCSGDPKTMFICTEPGAEMLRARKWPVRGKDGTWAPPTWAEFTALIDQIETKKKAGELQIESVAIDIVDNLYQTCQDFICIDQRQARGQAAVEHPHDMDDFGKTWGQVSKEWKKQLSRLMSMVRVRFITHAETKKVEIVNENNLAQEIDQVGPTFSGGKGGKCGQYLDGIVNAMGYMMQDAAGRHTITFKQTPSIAAKDRTDILASLGPIHLPDDPNVGFAHVSQLYEQKAKEAGLVVRSLWRG